MENQKVFTRKYNDRNDCTEGKNTFIALVKNGWIITLLFYDYRHKYCVWNSGGG